ncbi:hypothetical protein ACLHK8_05290 [Pediococcus sp. M21F004]|uniref:hypothetical protein n=1 Tax=Pediococcus sp. M21F004 TaxID=3390033 RepID=UPI003DA710F6
MKNLDIMASRLYEFAYLLLFMMFVAVGVLMLIFDSQKYGISLLIILLFGVGLIETIYRMIRPTVLIVSRKGIFNCGAIFQKRRTMIAWNNIGSVTTSHRSLITTLGLSFKESINGKDSMGIPLVGVPQKDIDEALYVIQGGITHFNTVQQAGSEQVPALDIEVLENEYKNQYIEKVSLKIWWLWAGLEVIAFFVAYRLGTVANQIFVTKNDGLASFIYFLIAVPTFLGLSEFCYWFIFRIGWHSTPDGRDLIFRRGNFQIPIFIKNTVSYVRERMKFLVECALFMPFLSFRGLA